MFWNGLVKVQLKQFCIEERTKIPPQGGEKLIKSNFVFVTCAEYNRCRFYCEMLTYEPFPNNAATFAKNVKGNSNTIK
jgi:hypothetical protein